MPNYAPLWNTILTSSIWEESKDVRILWMTMLAAKDDEGKVYSTVPGLARLSNLKIDEVRESLAVLESPDAESRSKEFEGRRIVPFEGGWSVLNHSKYRDKIAELREYNAKKQREYRRWKLQKANVAHGLPYNPLPGEAAYVKATENGYEQEASKEA
jgi:hypothetical protein